ncbi:MAG: cytochrome o ubiquinol oxidase subunit IV [Pseudomonadota bacterium]
MSDQAHGSLKSYGIGFALSVVLTLIPFGLVLGGALEDNIGWAIAIIFLFGGAQIMVHVYYFLHVTLGAEDGWQAMSLAFTGVLLVIILAGSIWVMFHLEQNMMPANELIERVEQLP